MLHTYKIPADEDSSNEDDDDLPGAGRRRASKESLDSTQSEEVESKLPGPVQRLMQLIFNQQYFSDTLASLEYDTEKMPLGKLSKRTLLKGYVSLSVSYRTQSQSHVSGGRHCSQSGYL
jgi:poly [ADP-ribose] polymerase